MLQRPKKRPEVRKLEDGRYGVFDDNGELMHTFDMKASAVNFAWDYYFNPKVEVLVFDEKDAPIPEARGVFTSLDCAADWLLNTFDWEWDGVEGMWVETIPASLRDQLADRMAACVRWLDSAVVEEDIDGLLDWNESIENIVPEWFPDDLTQEITDEIERRIREINDLRREEA